MEHIKIRRKIRKYRYTEKFPVLRIYNFVLFGKICTYGITKIRIFIALTPGHDVIKFRISVLRIFSLYFCKMENKSLDKIEIYRENICKKEIRSFITLLPGGLIFYFIELLIMLASTAAASSQSLMRQVSTKVE